MRSAAIFRTEYMPRILCDSVHPFLTAVTLIACLREYTAQPSQTSSPSQYRSVWPGQPALFHCDGQSVRIPVPSTVHGLELFFNLERVYVATASSHSRSPLAVEWFINAYGLAEGRAQQDNSRSFNLTVEIPRVSASYAGILWCQVYFSTSGYFASHFRRRTIMNLIVLEESCNDNWIYLKSSKTCMRLFHIFYTWEAARQYCQTEHNGDLISITSQSMDDFLTSLTNLRMGTPYWIGLNDIEKENRFVWASDQKAAGYLHWHRKPKLKAGRSNCVEKGWHAGGGWADVPCDREHGAICERSPDQESREKPSRVWYVLSVVLAVVVISAMSGSLVYLVFSKISARARKHLLVPLKTIIEKKPDLIGHLINPKGEAESGYVVVLYDSVLDEILEPETASLT